VTLKTISLLVAFSIAILAGCGGDDGPQQPSQQSGTQAPFSGEVNSGSTIADPGTGAALNGPSGGASGGLPAPHHHVQQ
jgi:hypothetical protein